MSKFTRALTMSAVAMLVVAGCGSGADETASTPTTEGATSASSSATTHSTGPGEPSLIAVPGYEYGSVAPELEQQYSALEDGKVLTSMSVHAVTKDGADVGYLVLFDMASKFADNPAVAENIVNGMAGGMAGAGGTVKQETISGEKVVVATGEGGSSEVVYAWFHDGTMSVFASQDADASSNFVGAYLQEANA